MKLNEPAWVRVMGRAYGEVAKARAARFLGNLYARIALAAADEAREYWASERHHVNDAEASLRLAVALQRLDDDRRAWSEARRRADARIDIQLAKLEDEEDYGSEL